MLSGEALVMPGFCLNRVVEFMCYMWMEPMGPPLMEMAPMLAPADLQGASNFSSYPEASLYHNDFYDTGGDDNYTDFYVDDEYTEKLAADFLTLYIFPVLLLVGTLSNLLCCVILFRLSQEVLSSCVYLSCLAILDLLILYTQCGNNWMRQAGHVDLSNMLLVSSSSACKVYPFLYGFLFHLSRWIIVCLAIEGVLMTSFPRKAQDYCSISRAKAAVLFLTVMLTCVNCHFFWSFEITYMKEVHQPSGRFCSFEKDSSLHIEAFQKVVWPLLELLIGDVLPYVITTTCGVIMLWQICSGRSKGDEIYQQWRHRYQLHPHAVDQITLAICLICICFPVLSLPKFSFLTYRFIADKYEIVEFSFRLEAQQILAQSCCSFIEYIYLAVVKMVICITCSEMFRTHLLRILRGCCRCLCRPSQTHVNKQETKDLLPTEERGKGKTEERFVEEWDSENHRYKYYREEDYAHTSECLADEVLGCI